MLIILFIGYESCDFDCNYYFLISLIYQLDLIRGHWMQDTTINGFVNRSEAFSIATLIYARLRRVTGRVIDVTYLMQNQNYTKYVIDLALSASDSDLQRQAERLRCLMVCDLEPDQINIKDEIAEIYESEVTEEEIYRAQVSHHYIGALR